MWNYVSFIIIILSVLIVMMIGITIWMNWEENQIYCGGTINLQDLPACGKIEKSKEDNEYNMVKVLDYFFMIQTRTPATFHNDLQSRYPDCKIYKGIFYFAIPELLKLLPTDFGQNASTPYGIISFFDSFSSCISSSQEFCQSLFKNTKTQSLCQLYFEKKKQEPCPFFITDSNNQKFIENPTFFNQIGLLGAISMEPHQVILLKVNLPLRKLHLNYWSFNVYLADNLSPNEICYPNHQTIVASICPPFNMYTSVGVSGKKFNPLTGEGDLLEKDHLNCILILTTNPYLGKKCKKDCESMFSVDVIHVFEIPSAPGSQPLESDLPNPNQENQTSSLFDPYNQRITLFFRMSPDPMSPDPSYFEKFVQNTSGNHFQTSFLSFPKSFPLFQYPKIQYPVMLNPTYNEIKNKSSEFQAMVRRIQNTLYYHQYRCKKIKTRNSTLNIFAPLFKNILNSNIPYKGGWQAIQMAGNAQGDNYDAQYRPSQSVCLYEKDVMIGIAVNHAFLDNSIYNSINIVDLNKTFGIVAFNLTNEIDCLYYIVLCGRNMSEINQVERKIKSCLDKNTKIFKKCISSTTKNGIPDSHHVLMVERTYLNPKYLSKTSPEKTYHLSCLFGKHGKDFLEQESTEDAWESLINVVGPQNTNLLSPCFLKTTHQPYWWRNVCLCILTILILILLVLIFQWKR